MTEINKQQRWRRIINHNDDSNTDNINYDDNGSNNKL